MLECKIRFETARLKSKVEIMFRPTSSVTLSHYKSYFIQWFLFYYKKNFFYYKSDLSQFKIILPFYEINFVSLHARYFITTLVILSHCQFCLNTKVILSHYKKETKSRKFFQVILSIDGRSKVPPWGAWPRLVDLQGISPDDSKGKAGGMSRENMQNMSKGRGKLLGFQREMYY